MPRFLLPKLLSLLEKSAKESVDRNSKAEPHFLADGCTVAAESGGYIDLRIERELADAKFAIIIENKVNNAPDQCRFRVSLGKEASQLEAYVERMRGRGFLDHEIYVFYIPLAEDRHAKRQDVEAITKNGNGATYARITFKSHILPWLETALKNWPSKLNREVGEKERGLLSLSAVEAAVESASSLKRVFERVLRARLLRRIHEKLRDHNLNPNYYVFEWPRILTAKTEPESEYADEFANPIVVGIPVNDTSAVGFGWDKEDGFWFAYLRMQDDQGHLDEAVQKEARSFLKEVTEMSAKFPFYAYKGEGTTPRQCEEEKTALDYADKLREMWNGLKRALG